MKKILGMILFGFISLMSGCVTTGNYIDPSNMPAVYQEFFNKCSPSQGESVFRFKSGRQNFVFSSEWKSSSADHLQLNFLDQIGRLQVGISMLNSDITLDGRSSKRLPNLSVGQEGKLLVDGYYSGVMARELACVLKGRLPAEWRGSLVDSSAGSQNEFVFEDNDRVIRSKFRKFGRSGMEVCSSVSWRAMGLIAQNLEWCFKGSKRTKSSLKYKDITLLWDSHGSYE